MANSLLTAGGFRRLFSAQVVSSFGDWLATFALMALVLDISGSVAAVGGVLALRLAPAAIAGPLLAWAGGRWGRRRLLLTLDVARAGLVALIPLVRALWWVYPLTLAMEIATVIAIAARDTSIRDLVGEDELPVANGAIMGASYGSIPLGAAAFTAISWLATRLPTLPFGGRFYLAFWIDSATFLVSFAFLSRIRELPNLPDLAGSDAERLRIRDALAVPLIRATLPPLAIASLGIGTLFSLGISFVRETLGAGDAQFGLLVLVFGLGASAGLVLRQKLGWGGVSAVRIGVTAMGAVLVMMAFAWSLSVAFVAAAAFGMAGTYAIVSGLTRLQADLAAGARFLALGAFHIGVRVALSVGALAAGMAVDLLELAGGPSPVRTVMLVSGLVVTLAATAVRVPEQKPRAETPPSDAEHPPTERSPAERPHSVGSERHM